MIRQLMLVWPPTWMLVGVGLFFAVFHGIFAHQEMLLGRPIFAINEGREFFTFAGVVIGILYAVHRVASFHPAYRPGYAEWLCSTPWTNRKPLPLGPVHLVWQDAVLLAALVGLSWPRTEWSALGMVQSFIATYVLALGFTHFHTGQKSFGYVTLFGFGLMMWCVREPVAFAAAAVSTYTAAFAGLRAALAGFPWRDAPAFQKMIQAFKNSGQNPPRDEKTLGWPFERLSPKAVDGADPGWHVTIVMGILLGWWFFVGHSLAREAGEGGSGYLIFHGFLIGGIIFRLGAYVNGYLPPITLVGRVATGRLIIPGYDQVFIAPLAMLATGVAVWYLPRWLDVHPIYMTSGGFVLAWWTICAMPPSQKSWRLTGNHRIDPGVINAAQRE